MCRMVDTSVLVTVKTQLRETWGKVVLFRGVTFFMIPVTSFGNTVYTTLFIILGRVSG